MNALKLGNRLSTAAEYVRSGAVVADIGTDHAYIPIYLISKNIASFAVASDINEGPIERAKENIKSYSFENKIATVVTNGLCGIDKYKPTDIIICGMGGELISEIISKSDYVKNPDIRLILQPMTCQKELRQFLSNGFCVIDESIVSDAGKIYQILCVQYDGKIHKLSNAQLELGEKNIEKRSELFEKFLFSTISKKQKRLAGLKVGGYDTSDIEKEIQEMEKLR